MDEVHGASPSIRVSHRKLPVFVVFGKRIIIDIWFGFSDFKTMNLSEIQTFLAVVETRSLVRAARRLNVTQSTVTARIDNLEDRLGQRLLNRSKAGTELTSAGFKFQRYAELMTQLWGQAQYEIGLPQGFTGVCNVGCYIDLWEGVGERFLAHIRRERPDVAVAVWPGDQANIDRWLATGLIDMAFCYGPEARGPFAIRELGRDDFTRVNFAPPKGESGAGYVFVDYGAQFRRDHAVLFAKESPSAVTLASARWAIDFLSIEGGSAYLPLRHARHFKPRGRIIADAPLLHQTIALVENTTMTGPWSWLDSALRAATLA
jgi:DNA-binding transcriptional LysR family regulator